MPRSNALILMNYHFLAEASIYIIDPRSIKCACFLGWLKQQNKWTKTSSAGSGKTLQSALPCFPSVRPWPRPVRGGKPLARSVWDLVLAGRRLAGGPALTGRRTGGSFAVSAVLILSSRHSSFNNGLARGRAWLQAKIDALFCTHSGLGTRQ
jgi:hypothetical protein